MRSWKYLQGAQHWPPPPPHLQCDDVYVNPVMQHTQRLFGFWAGKLLQSTHLHPPGSQEAVASLGFSPQSCIQSSQVNSAVLGGSLACNRMVLIAILAILRDMLVTGLSEVIFVVLRYLFQVRTTILKMVTKLTKSGLGGNTGIDCSIMSVSWSCSFAQFTHGAVYTLIHPFVI